MVHLGRDVRGLFSGRGTDHIDYALASVERQQKKMLYRKDILYQSDVHY